MGFSADHGAARLVEIGISLRRKLQDAFALTAEGARIASPRVPQRYCIAEAALTKTVG